MDGIGKGSKSGSVETGGDSDDHRDLLHGFIWGWFTKYISYYCLKGIWAVSGFRGYQRFWAWGADKLAGVCVRVRPCQCICWGGGRMRRNSVPGAVIFLGANTHEI